MRSARAISNIVAQPSDWFQECTKHVNVAARHVLGLSAIRTIVTDVRKLPESVRVSFCNIEKCNFVGVKFDMVNPSETMSTDYVIPGVPNKQLRFAALNGHSAIVPTSGAVSSINFV